MRNVRLSRIEGVALNRKLLTLDLHRTREVYGRGLLIDWNDQGAFIPVFAYRPNFFGAQPRRFILMLNSVDLELLKQLRAQIATRKVDLTDALAIGAGVNDFAGYRYKVGQLKALADMEAWGQSLNDKLMGNKPEKAA